jgi:hypothetical protein
MENDKKPSLGEALSARLTECSDLERRLAEAETAIDEIRKWEESLEVESASLKIAREYQKRNSGGGDDRG